MPIPTTFEARVELVARNMYEAVPPRERPRGTWGDEPLQWETLKQEGEQPLGIYYDYVTSIRSSAAVAVRTLYPDITDGPNLMRLGIVVHGEFSQVMVDLRNRNRELTDEVCALTLKNEELDEEVAVLKADLRNIAKFATSIAT